MTATPDSTVPATARPEGSVLKTLLLTDLVGSTRLTEQVGDQRASEIWARHDHLARELLARHDGREIDKSDGFLLLFDRPSGAVAYALAYHRALETLSHELEVELRARAGIHLGEVILRENPADEVTRGAKPFDVEGLAKPLAARVMGLARGGQTLLTRGAVDLARRAAVGTKTGDTLEWLAHGAYLLAGIDEPVELFEVGVRGLAPLSAPPESEKGKRAVTPDDELTLGWRPAAGLTIPTRQNWVLERGVGEGGFGEVWIAAHSKTGARRVFKFCFESERLRGLRREVVLFRLLKEALGDRDDIAQILDWQFDEPPYFLEGEYSAGGDLSAWAEERGGAGKIPLDERLELVAQTAVALDAAHSVGVLHKDIKPTNILIHTDPESRRARARLTDFGIGLVTDREVLAKQGITARGLTQTLLSGSGSTGTPLYLAPEVLAGQPPTTRSDVYALGVVLYQSVAGNFERILAPGWERDVDDELLREDIAGCVDGDPARRLASADELAQLLRGLEQRRAQLESEARQRREAERARRRRRQFTVASIVGVSLTVAVAALAWRESSLRERAQAASYVSDIQLSFARLEQGRRGLAQTSLERAAPQYRGWEWGYLAREAELGDARPGLAPVVLQTGETAAEIWRDAVPTVVATFAGKRGAFDWQLLFSGDGRRLIFWTQGTPVQVWDVDSGETIRLLPETSRGFLAGSHDGRWLVALEDASFGATPESVDHAMLWNVETGAAVRSFEFPFGGFFVPTFSPDDSALVVSSQGDRSEDWFEYQLTIWDVATGRLRTEITLPTVAPFPPIGVAFPSEGRVMAPWGLNELRTWDLITGELLDASTLPVAPDRFLARVVGKPDGGIVALSIEGGGKSGLGAARDVHSGRKIWEHADSEVDWYGARTADGTVTAGVGADGTIRFIETPPEPGNGTTTGPELARFVTDTAGQLASDYYGSAFSPDGSRYAYLDPDDGGIRILVPAAGAPRDLARLRGHGDLVLQLCFTPDGSRLVAGSLDHTLSVWDMATRERAHLLTGHEGPVTSVSCSPDGRSVFSTSIDGTVALWDTSTGGGRESHQWEVLRSGRQVFSPDGRRLVHQAAGPEAWVVDTATGEISMTLPGVELWPRLMFGDAVEVGAGGRTILNNHLLWDAESGEFIRDLGGTGRAFSPDGSLIAGFVGPAFDSNPPKDGVLPGSSLSVKGGELATWDARTGNGVRVFRDELVMPSELRFSPDGRRFAVISVDDNRVNVWDTETGDLVTTLCCPVRPYSARFSPGGRRVLTQSQRDGLGVWDLDGNELVTLTPAAKPYTVEWSPDGSLIAAALHDGSVQLWEALPWSEP